MVPWSNGGVSNTPIGPFQITVPARSMRAREVLSRVAGSMSNTAQPGGMRSRGTSRVSASGLELLGHDRAGRQDQLAPGIGQSRRARSTRSGSTSDLPVSSPIAAKNVQAIAPPSRIWSTFGSSAEMRSILPLILAPPSTATKGRFGFVQRFAQVAELLLHQEAGRRPA